MVKKIAPIIFLVTLIFSSCNQGQKSSELSLSQDSTLNKIKQGLSNMPILLRHSYVTIDSMKHDSIDYKQITNIQIRDKAAISENKFKCIDDLLDMELNLGINELLIINKKNYSYLPNNRKYFTIANRIGISEKYMSRKTNAAVNGFVIYKTNNEYYTYHLTDTTDFDLNIIGTTKDCKQLDIYYEIIKDSLIVSRHELKFQADTIIRYNLIE